MINTRGSATVSPFPRKPNLPSLRPFHHAREALCRIELENTGWLRSSAATHRIPTNPATEDADFDAAFIAELLQDESHRDACRTELGNLSATLGDLANALRGAGQLDAAFAAARQAAEMIDAIGQHRNHAASLGQVAQILMQQGRYDEADAEYDRALAALGAWFRLLSTTPESDLLRQLNSPPPDLPEPLASAVEQLKDALR